MKNVCYLVISRHRGVQLLPRPTPLLLTNPGHLLHPLHTSLVCSALTFLPDISSHLSACHGFPPIARNPSLFPLSHLTFPTPQPSTTVKISSLPSRLAVTASCPGRKAQVGCCPEERLVSTSRSLSCHHTTAARRPALGSRWNRGPLYTCPMINTVVFYLWSWISHGIGIGHIL